MPDENDTERMQRKAKLNMHKMFLEALRHREQDIVRFLAILGPALAGFIWLLGEDPAQHPTRFVGGTYGVLLTLVLGAFYALALGYNYRYLTLQLAKLEVQMGLERTVLTSWPRTPEAFIKRSRWGVVPWCTPPGIIKVFWVAFLVCILGVTIIASRISIEPPKRSNAAVEQPATLAARQQAAKMKRFREAIPWVGGACLALALLWPVSIGRKMLKAAREENPNDWQKRQADDG